MNCWKTFNLSRDIGFHRLTFMATMMMLLSFVTMYLPLSTMYPRVQLVDDGLIYFFIGLFFMTPVHNLLHIIPACLFFKKTKITIRWKYRFLPVIQTKICQSIPKNLSIISLIAPSVGITIPLIMMSILFPTHMHYLIMLAAFNIGISMTDFIYLILFLKAPRKCYIENLNGEFDILIRKPQ